MAVSWGSISRCTTKIRKYQNGRPFHIFHDQLHDAHDTRDARHGRRTRHPQSSEIPSDTTAQGGWRLKRVRWQTRQTQKNQTWARCIEVIKVIEVRICIWLIDSKIISMPILRRGSDPGKLPGRCAKICNRFVQESVSSKDGWPWWPW